MTTSVPVKLVYGGINFEGKSSEEVEEILDILKQHHVDGIDTSASHVSFLISLFSNMER
jgi:hypothetical protein